MKKLILPLVLTPFLAWSEVQEISDGEIKNKFLTVVKDVEVEGLLSKTAEFNDCREKNKFDPKNKNSGDLAAATKCFQDKLKGKNPEVLKKLADDLNLESYGLIKSKNVSDITDYLSKKMIKSLTGRDPDKVTKESLQWKNQKIVDQKVFIDLYTNQLVKSALMEVSRFCFENLRNGNGPTTSFEEHWGSSSQINLKADPVVSEINDQGKGEFFQSQPTNTANDSDPSEVYKNLISGITKGQSINAGLYSDFFGFCQKSLPTLCDEFKKDSKVTGSSQNIATTTPSINGKMTKGANACLTLDRLRSIRTAMKNTELVAKQFDEMGADKNKFALKMLNDPKIYQRGNGQGEESLDELTSFSSSDMLEGAEKNDLAKLEEQCKVGGQGGTECDQFLVKSDDLDKAIHNVETEMNLKREIEVERVRALKKKNDEELKKYLEENGYYDIVKDLDTLTEDQLASKIGNIFDARKVAEIESLKLKVGKRQVSEDEYNKLSDDDKTERKKDNITDTKEERARLAQVVMFNNIITSQLSLKDKKSGKEVGRNVNAWKKEMKGLTGYAGYSDSDQLFQGLQDSVANSGTVAADNASVVGADILEAILGKPED